MEYKYIFGPVLSRRFGKSIGIDLSPSKKQCNFDCLYCEVGKGKTVNQMNNSPLPQEIVKELKRFLEISGYPDVITITASGEPTLYPYLEKIIEEINYIKKQSKALILSNGSTINRPKIRKILKKLDIVKLSLDAGDQTTFKKVNKVIDNIHINEIINGMKVFRKEFHGQFIIEILFVRGVNDSLKEVKKLSKILKEIKPDRVDIGTIDRPPPYKVYPLTDKELLTLSEQFENLNVNVITRGKDKLIEKIDISEKQIIQTFKKRPYTYHDIYNIFREDTVKRIQNMIKEGKLKETYLNGETFIFPTVTN